MRWAVVDIPPIVTEQICDPNHTTQGRWTASRSSTKIKVFNATTFGFQILHAPCAIEALSDVGTHVSRGSSGCIEPSVSAPWVHRFERCVASLLSCDETVVGVIDAPDDIHIYQALEHMHRHKDRMSLIDNSETKYMILQGADGTSYLSVPGTGNNAAKATAAPWLELQSFKWGQCVLTNNFQEKAKCMQVALAHLWGTYEVYSTDLVANYTYPAGGTVPECMIEYIKYGQNISQSTSPAVSRTRGIRAMIDSKQDSIITVVCQFDDDAEEDPDMTLLRTLVTSSDLFAVGSAHFKLTAHLNACKLEHTAVFEQALANTARKYLSRTALPLRMPSAVRRASCTRSSMFQ